MYLTEILNDAQFSLAMIASYLGGIEISLVSEYMMKYLKPEGTFLVFSGITFLSIFFYGFVVKETKGLTDVQKKQLYYNDSICCCSKPPKTSTEATKTPDLEENTWKQKEMEVEMKDMQENKNMMEETQTQMEAQTEASFD